MAGCSEEDVQFSREHDHEPVDHEAISANFSRDISRNMRTPWYTGYTGGDYSSNRNIASLPIWKLDQNYQSPKGYISQPKNRHS